MKQSDPFPEASQNFVRRHFLYHIGQVMLFASAMSIFIMVVVVIWAITFPNTNRAEPELPDEQSAAADATRDPTEPLIGIVSGHAGYDPGAVCADGLSEAEVNQNIALEVVNLLARRGIETDLLLEYDLKLEGYRADALVSIHADSCAIPGATGFKVARITASAIPEAEDQLVACLVQEYARETQLAEHPASITDGMTNYHAFREIASTTPGVIIETGFMLEDRNLLENRPKLVARGIASGALCFLKSQGYDG